MYELRVTRQFIRAARKVDRASLEQVRDEIQADPYNARDSHVLAHDWAGFRAAEFEGRNRVIYRVCEECVQKHQENLNPLACCAETGRPTLVITFVDFGDYHHSAGRRRLRPASSYDLP